MRGDMDSWVQGRTVCLKTRLPLQSQGPLLAGNTAIDLGAGAMLGAGETAEELRPELLKPCATKVMEQPHAVEPRSPGVKYLGSRRPIERERCWAVTRDKVEAPSWRLRSGETPLPLWGSTLPNLSALKVRHTPRKAVST